MDKQIEKINVGLENNFLQLSVNNWKEQRDSLRKGFIEFWNQTGVKFKEFWQTTENEVRLAMCLASIQELSESIAQSFLFIHATCPEILPFLDNNPHSPEAQSATSIILGLMEKLAISKENDAEFSNKSVKESLSNASIIDSAFAAESLLLIRSCILLEFCSGIVVIWSNQEIEATGEPL